ncbi:hypothetical protein NIES3275_52930 [Microchaete diplosiphon NIES-3275]|nr:hypothetical protein NIES3275_52930 [Microchaete diplosiphon NIES-3275]
MIGCNFQRLFFPQTPLKKGVRQFDAKSSFGKGLQLN